MSASGPIDSPDLLEALQRSDERYRAFLRNSAEAIWRFELDEPIPVDLPIDEQVARAFRDGWLAECNDAMAKMYGYSVAADIIGARLKDLIVEDDPANVAYLRAFCESGYRLENMESHERDRDGHDKYFVNNLVGVIEHGALVRAWGTQRDVTQQRSAEAERQRHADEMRGALDRLNDLQRRLTDLTGASGTLLASLEGADLAAAIVRVARNLVRADAASVWLLKDGTWTVAAQEGLSDAYSRQALSIGAPSLSDTPLVIPDVTKEAFLPERQEAWAREGIRSMLIVPLKIRDTFGGALVLYTRTPRDYTDVEIRVSSALGSVAASALHIAELYEHRARSAQRASFLARAGALLSSSLDVKRTLSQAAALAVPHIGDWCSVHLVRADGFIEQLVVTHVNPDKVRWAESLRDLYPTDQSGQSGISLVIRTGEAQIVPNVTDEMIRASAKDERHLEILRQLAARSAIIVPMIARGRTVGAITLVTTEESGRRYDEEDLSLAKELASRAATAIDNARLYQEAQEANRLKDDFFATLSHELRTPVNAILGWSQMLAGGVLDDAGRARAVGAIIRNARAQAQLLSDILEMSRIVAGKIELQIDRFDLADLLPEIVESLRPTFEAKGHVVECRTSGNLHVHADRARVQQVIQNLLSNAVKFTPEKGRITIDAREDGPHVEVRVTDTGVGIAPEFLPYVFERFRQADSSATRTHGGLGIGLAVASHIVDLHHGTITASSAGKDQGATFVVRLPKTQH